MPTASPTSAGIAGILGVLAYLLAIFIPWPDSQFGTSAALLVISAFPILGIIFAHGLCDCVAAEAPGTAVRLGFVFAVAAFATLLAMIIVQLAVGAALPEIARELDAPVRRALARGLRMVDLGLDVAWDMLIGVALICLGWAMRPRRGLGPGWGIPAIVLGAALIVLNAATFPSPPGDRGLIDIGPLIGLFILALAARLAWLGRRAAATATP